MEELEGIIGKNRWEKNDKMLLSHWKESLEKMTTLDEISLLDLIDKVVAHMNSWDVVYSYVFHT